MNCDYAVNISMLPLLLPLLSAVVAAVAALRHRRCYHCSPLPLPLSLFATIIIAALIKQLSLSVSRLTSSLLLTVYR
ncbi:hypothetical protein B296_00025935 [Ensete ventricosum]|uniref:Uncharacterized protein n=1 Tax=Ensete ventricosum TaxID=4639 RepID=A0A426YHX5_ENSVE|nr:hypothetical protein B296_00025935 [Ensete ventricosum]